MTSSPNGTYGYAGYNGPSNHATRGADNLRVIMEYITSQVQEEQKRPLDLLVMDPTIQEDLGGKCGSGKVLRG
jgi:hypothetical protein